MPRTLLDALNTPMFRVSEWGKTPALWRACLADTPLLTSAEITEKLEASLLKWPYFTLLADGAQPPVSEYTLVRDVIGQKRGGFPNPSKIRELMRSGASLKLNDLADWHRPIRKAQVALENSLPVLATAYAFWTPPERRGMLPHRDAAHVLAIQLEGRKEWSLYKGFGETGGAAGLDVDTAAPTHQFVLEPGDVLYLPHGWPHDARARDGASLHLTFTLKEPTPEDFLDALVEHFKKADSGLVNRHHASNLEEKSEQVRQALWSHASSLEQDDWLALTLLGMRKTRN
jgi:hypothetical protein